MKLTPLSLLVAVGIFIAACASGPYAPSSDPNSMEAAGKPVVLLHEDLTRTLAVDQNVIAQRNANNLLHIQANFRNRTDDETLYIQVQTVFRNQYGFVLYSEPGSEAAWQNITLSPNQTINYSQNALTAEATKFIIRVRYLKDPSKSNK